MSVAAERDPPPGLPAQWGRLERAVEDAALSVALWKRRAEEAEEEVLRLRHALEAVASVGSQPQDVEEELRRLRAENVALESRMIEARRRVASLMRRLLSLGVEP